MLTATTVQKIQDFVYSKPRSIDEIAKYLGKNWRTADRYVKEIEEELGTITTTVFRPGSRGALKIVYWASVEKVSSSIFQKILEEEIFHGRNRQDFYPFDLYQHVPEKYKKFEKKVGTTEATFQLSSLRDLLLSAKKEMLIFSGNLSFINFKSKDIDTFDVLDEVVKRGIKLKVITRVDIGGKENIERLLSLNFKYGKELVEIRHRNQPLRAIVVDKNLLSIKDVHEPSGKKRELNVKTYFFYSIKDSKWIQWMTKIFWKMFSEAVTSERRLEELNKLK